MRAIILAAGRGQRLQAITKKHPKCFTPIHGKSLINWQLQALSHKSITQIAIITGYLAHYFNHSDTAHLKQFHNPNWANSNMVTSLLAAKSWLEKTTCIISYSDIIYSRHAIQNLITQPADIAISYDPNWLNLWQQRFTDPLEDAEAFQHSNHYLTKIGQKQTSVAHIQGQYMGLLKITPDGWLQMTTYLQQLKEKEIAQLDMTDLLNRLIQAQVKIRTIAISDPWYEVDSPRDLDIYKKLDRTAFPR